MIKNYKCENCTKSYVCKVNDILLKFHEDAKKDLMCDIEISECKNYSSTEEE